MKFLKTHVSRATTMSKSLKAPYRWTYFLMKRLWLIRSNRIDMYRIALLILLALPALGLGTSQLEVLFVNCSLSADDNVTHPLFRSVAAAQTYIRDKQLLQQVNVKVMIDGVCVPVEPSSSVLAFNLPADVDLSGRHSVTFTSWVSRNRAVLSGEIKLLPNRWRSENDTNLITATLTPSERTQLGADGFGLIQNGDLGQCTTNKLELFTMSQPMILARYPNPSSLEAYNGPWMNWMHVSPLTLTFPEPHSFLVEEPRCSSWTGNYQEAAQVWLHGFWSYDWADNFIRVLNINVSAHGQHMCRITYDSATPPVYGIVPTARFYIVNLPSEVDMPGEYYIDELSATITLLPPVPNEPPPVMFLNAASGAPLVSQSMPLVTGVTLDRLELRFSRSMAVSLTNAVSNVTLSSLLIHSVGSAGLSISGANATLSALNVSRCGCSAIAIAGGNMQTLVSANLTLEDSSMTQWARWTRTYNPGIHFYGVGFTVRRNIVFNAPHQGMTGSANNAVFHDNRFAHLCFEVRDSGAWYIGRSWVRRGVVVANNVFEHIQAIEPTALGSDCVSAIYLDDQQSGVEVVNNTCNDVYNCILLGGGRDNVLQQNNCANVTSCILFDNRGMNWEAEMCSSNATYTGQLVEQLLQVNYQRPPYSTAYPALPSLLKDRPCVPVNNSVVANTFCIATGGFIDQSNTTITSWGSSMRDNVQKCL